MSKGIYISFFDQKVDQSQILTKDIETLVNDVHSALVGTTKLESNEEDSDESENENNHISSRYFKESVFENNVPSVLVYGCQTSSKAKNHPYNYSSACILSNINGKPFENFTECVSAVEKSVLNKEKNNKNVTKHYVFALKNGMPSHGCVVLLFDILQCISAR